MMISWPYPSQDPDRPQPPEPKPPVIPASCRGRARIQPRAADSQNVPRRHAEVRVAKVFPSFSRYDSSRRSLVSQEFSCNPARDPPIACQTNIVSCRGGFVPEKYPDSPERPT